LRPAIDTGQDVLYYLKDKSDVERSILTHSDMFTNEDAKGHTATLVVDGDVYDIQNMGDF
jgi:hypothetical protein